ncbi:bile acid-CoA:amino acid N-acyltransferase-like [Clavelina lepadiformis]|uniref:bile acid-CoA:amino acid N-acyltransferase-like n=1 Tax=Clavelina lepadiformis TaxID=159417 RepID=UPI004041FCC9
MAMGSCPTIEVSSIDSMSDQPISIIIKGLQPNQLFTLHSWLLSDNQNTFDCIAQYISNEKGIVSLEKDKSIAGSYIGNKPMGLFWAMQPSIWNKKPHARLAKLDVTTPMVVTITVYNARINSLQNLHSMKMTGKLDSLELASIEINRWFMSPGTKRITFTMEKDGIHGSLFIPPGVGPFPGVITLFGGYPGTMEFKASLLASHGFAALALAYYGVPGLNETFSFKEPNFVLDLGYFERAVNILCKHSQIYSHRGVGIIGLSASSSMILALSVHIEAIKCVIWLSGSIYPVFVSLGYKKNVYKSVPFDGESFTNFIELGDNRIVSGRYFHPKYNSENRPSNDSVINFYEQSDVAFMFIAGLDDENAPAEFHANEANRLLTKAKHPNFKILRYPGAGHLIEPSYAIHNFLTAQKGLNYFINWGGSTVPHCAAQKDSWQKQIEFLKSNIGGLYGKL